MTTTFSQPAPSGEVVPENVLYHLAAYAVTLDNAGLRQVRDSLPGGERGRYDEILAATTRVGAAGEAELERRLMKQGRMQRRVNRSLDAEDAAANGRAGSWNQIGHDEALAAAEQPAMTTVGRLVGDLPLCLFYAGKINGVHAESEAGKSWLTLLCAAQEVSAGQHVLYLDFEDDAGSVYRRLKLLGAAEDAVRQFFHYVSPTGPLTDAERETFGALVGLRGTLAVVDGVTEAMALEGLTGRDEADVAAWHARVTKQLAAAGWAVITIDHIPHGEKRAIGSQHKRSAITGASYLLEAVQPIAPGLRGVSRLRVDKDRGGWVRGHAAPGKRPQWFADIVLDFSAGSVPNAALFAAKPKEQAEEEAFTSAPPKALCEAVLAFVEANPGCGTTSIRSGVKGANDAIAWAVEWLISRNHLTKEREGQKVAHGLGTVPFDQETVTLSACPNPVRSSSPDSVG
ncbi:AAA family ATPase [Streptomyces sp. ISL-100]|uniref:AAA family ATPase n=1 Tax=Streptomyces sp. ISL-100 TaxID=2819173 RepID=UPI001BEC35A6|nr:AAA family ATPase [Streptomyces sp. ISL-100]MBT2401271.1 hypothetical protein [Streptomyces sp. ISL-100]